MAFDTPPSSLEFPTALLEEGMNNYFPPGTMHSYNYWDNWVIPISISGSERDCHDSEFSFSRTQLNDPNCVTVAKYEIQFDLNSKNGNLSKIQSKIISIKKLMDLLVNLQTHNT